MLVLVPNLRGAQSAVAAGVTQIYQVISTSEEHNKANLNATREKSLENLSAIRDAFPDLKVSVSFSAVFGCPFVGENPIENVLWLAEEVTKRGVKDIALSDTIGVANPLHVEYVIKKVREAYPNLNLAMHLHDTHGMGLASSLAALRLGVERFETAVGGLGGCPFAPGAAGNLATEDLVNMVHRMGVKTGIDMEKLLVAARTVKEKINPNIPGRMVRARTFSEFRFFNPSLA
jgi:hydroxymethylglutaryl-CoA lyase